MTDDTMRRQIGRRLLRWALRVLPEWSDEKQAIEKALEQRAQYDSYRALAVLLDQTVLPFSRWIQERKRFEHWRRFMGGIPKIQRTPIPARVVAVESEAMAL